ncbi:MAG: hypothetical protein ACHREM_22010 [Polyangiales bacterium]
MPVNNAAGRPLVLIASRSPRPHFRSMLTGVSLLADIVVVVEGLDARAQQRVLELATRLRDHGTSSADLALPVDLDDESQWDRWGARWGARADAVLAERRTQLERAGLMDASGAIVTDRWPADMAPGSKTSVET